MKLKSLVDDYIFNHRNFAAAEWSFYAAQPDLSLAIRISADCIRPDGKRHSHQRRIPRAALEEAGDQIFKIRDQLGKASNFLELHSIISASIRPIRGIGELTVYDIALRIGAFLNIEPTLIYLHAGTKVGASALSISGETARRDQFPPEVQVLTAREIEDFLCIYKNRLLGRESTAEGCARVASKSSCYLQTLPKHSRC